MLRTLIVFSLLTLLLPLMAQESVETQPPIPGAVIPAPPSSPAPPTPNPDVVIQPKEPPAILVPPSDEPLPHGMIRIYAERIIFSGQLQMAEFFGDVTIQTDQVLIHSNEASYNRATDLAVARGIVSIRAADGITYWGSALEYNARSRQWRFLDFSTQYPPAYLGAPFIAPVYINGGEASGLPNGVRASNSSVTTCDLPNPHYYIKSRRVDIYPQDKLIAYDNDVYLLGHRILHIPWFFLSLKQHQSPIVPVVGQNAEEGYFARFLYQYVLSPTQLGGVRLDLTQKLGPGLGIDHFYTFPSSYGEVFLYGRQGLSETVVRVDHTQQLPAGVVLNLTTDIRKNSQFTLQTTTATNINANFHRNGDDNSELLNYTENINKSDFLTDNKSANLRYNLNEKWGTLQYSSEYSSFGYVASSTTGTTPANQTLWNRLQVMDHLGFGDLNLHVDERMDLGGAQQIGTNPIVGVQRLPEIYLETGPSQFGCNYLNFVPTRFTIGWGLYNEHATGASLARYLFNWQTNTKNPITLGNTQIFPTFTFRQTSYGDRDSTAYYYYSGNVNAQTKCGPFSNVLTYGKQDAHGFTPFSFDTIYPYETVTESLQFYTNPLRMYLTSGRDLLHGQWQDITYRSDAQLTRGVAMHQSIGYDLNNSQWRDLVSQFNFLHTNRFIFNIGTRYNLTGTGLSTVSTELDWVVSSKWRVQWIGSYDGASRQLTADEFLFIRDLHCWDAALLVSRQQHLVYLYVRLKALNLPLPFFGIGKGGQVLDTNMGVPN